MMRIPKTVALIWLSCFASSTTSYDLHYMGMNMYSVKLGLCTWHLHAVPQGNTGVMPSSGFI